MNTNSRPAQTVLDSPAASALAMADGRCVQCNGSGTRKLRKRAGAFTCRCVYRRVFRACLAKYRECRVSQPGAVVLLLVGGQPSYARPEEDYLADFDLVAQRALAAYERGANEGDLPLRVFRLHHVQGCQWSEACRKLGIDRGTFFHTVYAVEEILGRAFLTLQPYILFPRGYFTGRVIDHLPALHNPIWRAHEGRQ